MIHLSCERDTAEDLQHIKDIAVRFPGPCPLRLNMSRADGSRLLLAAADTYRVDGSDELRRELAAWMGEA
jgi:hypothetical protein